MAETSFFDKLTKSMKSGKKKPASLRKVHFADEEEKPKKAIHSSKVIPVEAEVEELNTPIEEGDEEEGQLTIDVYQTPTHIVIKSTIAGVKPDDIDIDINQDMVTIKGTRKQEESIKEEDYFYQECYWGAFSRSVILPQDISPDGAEASMKNGILIIRLPKIESSHGKKLKIKTTS